MIQTDIIFDLSSSIDSQIKSDLARMGYPCEQGRCHLVIALHIFAVIFAYAALVLVSPMAENR